MNDFRLDGKTALVTGASSGLGAHFAELLARQGARVVLTARRSDRLAEGVEKIRAAGGEAIAVAMDVTDPASVVAAFDQAGEVYGAPDILINNAGAASEPTKFLETDEPHWNGLIETNLNGAWRVAGEAARRMAAADRHGSIVNIASIYGLRTGALKVAYNVSKAGVVQLTRSMAVELVRKNIRVNSLCPGWFRTAMNEDYFDTDGGKRYIKTIPMGRLGRIEELDGPLLLLASDAGGYMTGAEIVVDGGITQGAI